MSYRSENGILATGTGKRSSIRRSSRLVRSFLALLSVAALSAVFASSALATPPGPGQLGSCQLDPNGQNPCPDAGQEEDNNHPGQLCTLGYGPDGKLGCVDESQRPDDFKSCDPDPLHPEDKPCGGGKDGGGGDGGGGGGEEPEDEPVDPEGQPNAKGKDLRLSGGIVVPTRIDTGAGGSASAGDWVVSAVMAIMVAGIAIGAISQASGSAGRGR